MSAANWYTPERRASHSQSRLVSSCKVAGCTNRVKGQFSTFCNVHRQHSLVNGDPLQRAVALHMMLRWTKWVREVFERDNATKLRALVDHAWAKLVNESIRDVEPLLGKPIPKVHPQAWKANRNALHDITMLKSQGFDIFVIFAAHILIEHHDKLFVTHKAAQFNAVRLIRRMVPGSTWAQPFVTEKFDTVQRYKRITTWHTKRFYELLSSAYLPLASRLLALYEQEASLAANYVHVLDEAVTDLTLDGRAMAIRLAEKQARELQKQAAALQARANRLVSEATLPRP